MRGTLSLTSPWARRPFREERVREAVQARIPSGWTVSVYCNSDGTAYGIRVIQHGRSMSENRVVWGGDGDRHYYRDVHVGIADALAWIEWNRLGAATVTLEAAG
jgi:hypothetical protein